MLFAPVRYFPVMLLIYHWKMFPGLPGGSSQEVTSEWGSHGTGYQIWRYSPTSETLRSQVKTETVLAYVFPLSGKVTSAVAPDLLPLWRFLSHVLQAIIQASSLSAKKLCALQPPGVIRCQWSGPRKRRETDD